MLRRAIAATVSTALALLALAAYADTLAVTGVLRSQGGGPVADGAYGLVVRFYGDDKKQDVVFKESLVGVAVQGGLFHVVLGKDGGLDGKVLAKKAQFVGVQVDADPELPLVALVPVLRAFRADVADAAGKADSADEAKHALKADEAKTAGSATLSDLANTAKTAEFASAANTAKNAEKAVSAEEATSAKSADKLACTGCVTLQHLAADVAQGFLPVKGGTVTGALKVEGGLSTAIVAGDAKTAPCTDKLAGQLIFDGAKKRLYLCDGSKQQQLTVCSELCKPAAEVACGKVGTDGCGDENPACQKGNKCDPGLACIDGKCAAPGSQTSPVASCKELAALLPSAKTGKYWLDPDGAGVVKPFEAWCDMDTSGGGWTLVSVVSSHDGVASMSCGLAWDYKSDNWTDGGTVNAGDFDEKKDHKYLSYSSVPFGEFLMVEKVGGGVGWKHWSLTKQPSFATMMKGSCTTLANTPVASGGKISADNALVYANNLLLNCNSDYTNNDDRSRLHGNSPGNPQGACYNGGWGLGVDGDYPNCEWASEARPQTGGWTTQCYPFTGYYTGGEMCGAGCAQHHDSGTFVGSLFVR